jgi:hypothetical protein
MRAAFARLDDEQRGNLRWHAAEGTRIFCGVPAAREKYISPDGYG